MCHLSRNVLVLVVTIVVTTGVPATAQITVSFDSALFDSQLALARTESPIIMTIDTDGSGNVDPGGTTITSLEPSISDNWTITGSSALAIDQVFSFEVFPDSTDPDRNPVIRQRKTSGIGINGGNSGRIDGTDELLNWSVDLSSVPSSLQFQLEEIGFSDTNAQSDPIDGSAIDPDLVITDFESTETVFENIHQPGAPDNDVFPLVVDPGDVVLAGGSTGVFTFSQGQLGNPPTQYVGYTFATLTFDFTALDTFQEADFNEDGSVDGDDFLIWQNGFGGPGDKSQGDANEDDFVDGDDFLIWQTQFGSAEGAAAEAIPEPASLALLLGMLLLVAARRRVTV